MRNRAQWRTACPPKGKRGGVEWEKTLHYRAFCGCAIDAGYLLTGLLKDKQCRLWSTRETGLEGKVPDSGNKFLPSFAGLTGYEQLRRADTILQGPHLRGQSSASRAVAAGSLHVHRCTGNTHLQSGLSVGSAWGDWMCSVRGRGSEEPRGRQSLPQTFSPMWKFSLPPLLPAACAHPCSSSPRCWERSSGSTEYMSFGSSFRL